MGSRRDLLFTAGGILAGVGLREIVGNVFNQGLIDGVEKRLILVPTAGTGRQSIKNAEQYKPNASLYLATTSLTGVLYNTEAEIPFAPAGEQEEIMLFNEPLVPAWLLKENDFLECSAENEKYRSASMYSVAIPDGVDASTMSANSWKRFNEYVISGSKTFLQDKPTDVISIKSPTDRLAIYYDVGQNGVPDLVELCPHNRFSRCTRHILNDDPLKIERHRADYGHLRKLLL